MSDFFIRIWHEITVLFSTGNVLIDIIDILLVTYIIYKALGFMRETRAEQLLKGIIIIAVIYGLASLLQMTATVWLLGNVFQIGLIVILVLFQPELRSALEKMGRSKIGSGITRAVSDTHILHQKEGIDAICRAVQSLQNTKTGALIVMERTTMLGEIAGTGVQIDAMVSTGLLLNIFYPNTPLHDGAVIIRDFRVESAGCILPLTAKNEEVDAALGTRHRAALGCSETSDALVIVVSEETGIISVAEHGVLERNFNFVTIRSKIESAMDVGNPISDGKVSAFARWFNIKRWFKRK